MKLWNKRFSIAILSLTLMTLNANGQEYIEQNCDSCYQPSQDACCNNCCDCCFENVDIGVDFLWWQPCIDSLDVAVTEASNSTTSGAIQVNSRRFNYKTIDPKWTAGIRATVVQRSACRQWSLIGSYTYVRPIDSIHVRRPNSELLFNLLTEADDGSNFDRIRGEWKARYQTFDALATYPFQFCDCHRLAPYFGLTGLFLNQTLTSTSTSTTVVSEPAIALAANPNFTATRWDSNFWGLGLKFGASYEYCFCNGIKLIGNGAAMIVAGDVNNSNTTTVTTNGGFLRLPTRFNDHKITQCTPGWHLQVSALYETCCCNTDVFFRVGYEFVHWCHVPNPRRFFDADGIAYLARSTPPQTAQLGFNGFFVGLGAKF